MKAITAADGEVGKMVVFFASWQGLFERHTMGSQCASEVGNGAVKPVAFLFMSMVSSSDCLDEQFGNALQPDRISDVKTMNGVSSSLRQDGVDVGLRHGYRSGDGGVRGLHWEQVGGDGSGG